MHKPSSQNELFPRDIEPTRQKPTVNTYGVGAAKFMGAKNKPEANSRVLNPGTANKPGSARLSDLTNAQNPQDDLRQFMRIYGFVGSTNANRRVSEKTFTNRRVVIWATFNLLRESIHGFRTFSQFQPKHINKILAIWSSEKENGSMFQTYETQVQNFSVLTWFWRINGIKVDPIKTYIDNDVLRKKYSRSSIAARDKSWSANNVDYDKVYEEALRIDPVVARLIKLGRTFGLRINETLRLTPNEDDKGNRLVLDKGTKTGRPREIEYGRFDNEHQLKNVIASVKSELSPKQHSAWLERDLKEARRRVYYVLDAIGVTVKNSGVSFHGLRTEWAIEQFEALTGELTPIRGGHHPDYKKFSEVRHIIARAMGHNRIRVTCAYYGSFFMMKAIDSNRFDASWRLLKPCLQQIKEVLDRHDVKNLWWVGKRANGQNRDLTENWEFIVDDTVTPAQFGRLQDDLPPEFEDMLGYGVFLRHTLKTSTAIKEIWEQSAMPLFEIEAPEMHLVQLMEPARPFDAQAQGDPQTSS